MNRLFTRVRRWFRPPCNRLVETRDVDGLYIRCERSKGHPGPCFGPIISECGVPRET